MLTRLSAMSNFARKHKYPLRHSAFTHCDNYIPSRRDFAKERFGGSFTTEQVENVKIFLRILVVLFAVGPVFALEVPASFFDFPLFAMHTLHYHNFGSEFCNNKTLLETIITGSGSMMIIMSTMILFPIYIWITFSLSRKKVLKLFRRLGVGIVICLLGVMSLLIIDVVGHSMNGADGTSYTQCVFRITVTNHGRSTLLSYPTLDMHWAVLIPPNLLLGIGPLMVITTTFEFISALSPQSMKGLLVGVFFVHEVCLVLGYHDNVCCTFIQELHVHSHKQVINQQVLYGGLLYLLTVHSYSCNP